MEQPEKKRVKIRVSGQVQGVGYRFFTQRTACTLGIDGHVENEPDGSVTIEAEGSSGQLEQFMQVVSRGPQWARIEEVNAEDLPAEGKKGFTVKE